MLHINDLSFRHGERVLFDRASAAISDGWKVGLVGRNGAGKSTLLRLIQGEIEADGGEISLTGRTRVGRCRRRRPAATSPSWTRCWPPTSSAPPCWPRPRPPRRAPPRRDP